MCARRGLVVGNEPKPRDLTLSPKQRERRRARLERGGTGRREGGKIWGWLRRALADELERLGCGTPNSRNLPVFPPSCEFSPLEQREPEHRRIERENRKPRRREAREAQAVAARAVATHNLETFASSRLAVNSLRGEGEALQA